MVVVVINCILHGAIHTFRLLRVKAQVIHLRDVLVLVLQFLELVKELLLRQLQEFLHGRLGIVVMPQAAQILLLHLDSAPSSISRLLCSSRIPTMSIDIDIDISPLIIKHHLPVLQNVDNVMDNPV